MRLGSFQLNEPLPQLREPHALATLRPWVDVGSVGTLTLRYLEKSLGVRELARLSRPGNFFDFTRYRPMISLHRGRRDLTIPNSVISYARREEGNDFVLLHLLEPHMLGELYVSSLLSLLQRLGVRRYTLLGSMYDVVPHSRPLLLTGVASGGGAREDFNKAGAQTSDYEGPTTIATLILQEAPKLGMETLSIIARMPQYTQLEEDYMGQVRLLQALHSIYGLPVGHDVIVKAEQQFDDIDTAVAQNPQVKAVVSQLEAHYDARAAAQQEEEEKPRLSPEIEKFLKEMERRFRQE
ncbi:PAC2 family protein [Chloroflexota bacterium]